MVDFPGHIVGGQPNIGALAAQPPIEVEQDFSPEAIDARKSKWLEFFKTPQVQAALLQFGVSALQPKAPGQTTVGAIAGAIGEGAEAAGRVTAGQAAAKQQQAELGLQERRVGAVETQAEIGKAQLGLAETRITNQANQFTRTLEQNLGIAKNSALSKMATSLMVEEIRNADLAGRAPDFAGITQQVVAMQRALAQGEAAPAAAFDPSTLTPEEIKGSFDRAVAAGQAPEQVKAKMLEGGITQAQLDTALSTKVSAEVKAPVVQESPNKAALLEMEKTLIKRSTRGRGQAIEGAEEAQRLAGAKESAVALLRELYPNGVEDISKEDFEVFEGSSRLKAALDEAFSRKNPGITVFSELRNKFISKTPRTRGLR